MSFYTCSFFVTWESWWILAAFMHILRHYFIQRADVIIAYSSLISSRLDFWSSSLSEYSAQGQVLHCNSGTKAVVLLKDRPSTANSGTTVAVLLGIKSTAVEQVVACALVTQRARVRFPVGTSFLGEVFSGFFLTCKTNVGKLSAPKVPEYHLTIIIIHTQSLRAPMTWDVDAP